MLYPKISNIKKSNQLIKALLIVSVIVSAVLLLIQVLIKSKFNWAVLSIAGIIYIWVTVIYSIKKNVNIAYQVMVQMLLVSVFMVAIDYIIGYKGWAFTMRNTNCRNCRKCHNVNINYC